MNIEHAMGAHHPATVAGEYCIVCKVRPARHKVAEVIDTDWPELAQQLIGAGKAGVDAGATNVTVTISRHELTTFLCCEHFGVIMGAMAQEMCLAANTPESRAD